jgi:hypothetical protein
MENWVKAIILSVVVLAGLTVILNSHSNTLVSYPSFISLNSDQNLSNNYPVSPSDAIAIANSNVPAFGEVRYGVTIVKNGENPYYIVTMYENNPGLNNYGKAIVVSRVDAKTGQFLGVSVMNN